MRIKVDDNIFEFKKLTPPDFFDIGGFPICFFSISEKNVKNRTNYELVKEQIEAEKEKLSAPNENKKIDEKLKKIILLIFEKSIQNKEDNEKMAGLNDDLLITIYNMILSISLIINFVATALETPAENQETTICKTSKNHLIYVSTELP